MQKLKNKMCDFYINNKTKINDYFKIVKKVIYISFFSFIIIFSIIFIYCSLNTFFLYPNIEKVSFFGQYVGGILGPLWALAGVILFTRALMYQRMDLNHQRKEFQIQRFENLFYYKKEHYTEFKKYIEHSINGKIFKGIDATKYIINNIHNKAMTHLNSLKMNIDAIEKKSVISLYNMQFENISTEERDYIHNLEKRILNLINCVNDDNFLSQDNMIEYYKIIKDSIIEENDLKLLACFSLNGGKISEFKKLYIKLDLSNVFSKFDERIFETIKKIMEEESTKK